MQLCGLRRASAYRPTLRRLCSAPSEYRRNLTGESSPSEFRHNLATDEWVVFSAARRGRPRQVVSHVQSQPISELPDHDSECPFCRGNEHLSSSATLTEYYEGSTDWRLRTVPNKYPAVSPADHHGSDMPVESDAYQLGERVDAVGFHEVVIETPHHNLPTALAEPEQVECMCIRIRMRMWSCASASACARACACGPAYLHLHTRVHVHARAAVRDL